MRGHFERQSTPRGPLATEQLRYSMFARTPTLPPNQSALLYDHQNYHQHQHHNNNNPLNSRLGQMYTDHIDTTIEASNFQPNLFQDETHSSMPGSVSEIETHIWNQTTSTDTTATTAMTSDLWPEFHPHPSSTTNQLENFRTENLSSFRALTEDYARKEGSPQHFLDPNDITIESVMDSYTLQSPSSAGALPNHLRRRTSPKSRKRKPYIHKSHIIAYLNGLLEKVKSGERPGSDDISALACGMKHNYKQIKATFSEKTLTQQDFELSKDQCAQVSKSSNTYGQDSLFVARSRVCKPKQRKVVKSKERPKLEAWTTSAAGKGAVTEARRAFLSRRNRCLPGQGLSVVTEDAPFICTVGCRRRFKTFWDWARHERSNGPSEGYICDLGPTVTAAGGIHCSRCGSRVGACHCYDAVAEKDRPCNEKGIGFGQGTRLFERCDKLREHFRRFHAGLSVDSYCDTARFDISYSRVCGFCGERFSEFEEWAKHVAAQLKKRGNIDDWHEPWIGSTAPRNCKTYRDKELKFLSAPDDQEPQYDRDAPDSSDEDDQFHTNEDSENSSDTSDGFGSVDTTVEHVDEYNWKLQDFDWISHFQAVCSIRLSEADREQPRFRLRDVAQIAFHIRSEFKGPLARALRQTDGYDRLQPWGGVTAEGYGRIQPWKGVTAAFFRDNKYQTDLIFDVIVSQSINGKVLGEGSSSRVIKVLLPGSNEAIALKYTKQTAGKLLREARFLKKLNHPNITQFRGILLNSSSIGMMLSPVASQTLQRALEERIELNMLFKNLGNVSEAVGHVHLYGVHMDLKPSNILVTGRKWILSDFGISCRHDDRLSGYTRKYAAPEVLHSRYYSSASDIFSLGATFADVLAWIYGSQQAKSVSCYTERRSEVNMWLSQLPLDLPRPYTMLWLTGFLIQTLAMMLSETASQRPTASDVAALWLKQHDECAEPPKLRLSVPSSSLVSSALATDHRQRILVTPKTWIVTDQVQELFWSLISPLVYNSSGSKFMSKWVWSLCNWGSPRRYFIKMVHPSNTVHGNKDSMSAKIDLSSFSEYTDILVYLMYSATTSKSIDVLQSLVFLGADPRELMQPISECSLQSNTSLIQSNFKYPDEIICLQSRAMDLRFLSELRRLVLMITAKPTPINVSHDLPIKDADLQELHTRAILLDSPMLTKSMDLKLHEKSNLGPESRGFLHQRDEACGQVRHIVGQHIFSRIKLQYAKNQQICLRRPTSKSASYASPPLTYQCTTEGCRASFYSKTTWIKHEESNWPQIVWCCTFPECLTSGLGHCIFPKRRGYRMHLQQIHAKAQLKPEDLDRATVHGFSDFPRECPRCNNHQFYDWHARLDHLAEHFEKDEQLRLGHKTKRNREDEDDDQNDGSSDEGGPHSSYGSPGFRGRNRDGGKTGHTNEDHDKYKVLKCTKGAPDLKRSKQYTAEQVSSITGYGLILNEFALQTPHEFPAAQYKWSYRYDLLMNTPRNGKQRSIWDWKRLVDKSLEDELEYEWWMTQSLVSLIKI